MTIADERGKKVIDSIEGGAEFLSIGDELYSRKSIDKVIAGGMAAADPHAWAHEAAKALADRSCHAKHSIQLAINNLALQYSGKASELNPEGASWQQLISDADWREMMRTMLHETAQQWCDDKAGSCACNEA